MRSSALKALLVVVSGDVDGLPGSIGNSEFVDVGFGLF
jgi:hypothetical protein